MPRVRDYPSATGGSTTAAMATATAAGPDHKQCAKATSLGISVILTRWP